MSVCSKCIKPIKAVELKACSNCNANYHYHCLGISAENFSKESKSHKSTWKCSDCRSSEKRGETSNVTPQPRNSGQVSDSPAGNSFEDLKKYIDRKLEETLTRLLRDIKRDFSSESSDTRNKIQDLTESVNLMTSKCDQLKQDLEVRDKKIDTLEAENSNLRTQLNDLSDRVNKFEQQSRDCNIEIQCVPEHKTENLKTIVWQLATTVGYALPEHEVLNYHRVAKINQESSRPRSIIVKLSSPLVRDKIIAAVKTYNRTHQNDKFSSAHLGLGGEKRPVYVCEHLSPANKQLHAAARRTAKQINYQFVWVRNGLIYMRKDISSRGFVVKDLDTLKNLTLAK